MNDEQVRLNIVAESLSKWSEFSEKVQSDYVDRLIKMHEERRGMFKYIGTIAGAGATLAPQMFGYVQQPNFFYWGIALLILTVIISVTYVLSGIEMDINETSEKSRKFKVLVLKMVEPKLSYIKNGDYSLKAFQEAMTKNHELATAEEEKEIEEGWFKSHDYSGVYVIWFLVSGIALLILSLTSHDMSWKGILWIALGSFALVNMLDIHPRKIFTLLGIPMDFLRSIFRVVGVWLGKLYNKDK